MDDLFRVGVITSTHGVKGEVKVFPTTDDPMRFKKIKKVIMDDGKEKKELEIQQARFFKNMVILKFKEFNNINEVEKYKKAELWVTRDKAIPLQKDEYYIADLIGMSVVSDEDEDLGLVDDVMTTAANDVYVIKTQTGEEILLPAIKSCVLDVDMEARVMKVHIIPGLRDL